MPRTAHRRQRRRRRRSSIGGTRADGSTFVQYELVGSAYGGRGAIATAPPAIAVLLSNARTRADRDPRERVPDARPALRTDRRFRRRGRISRRSRRTPRSRSARTGSAVIAARSRSPDRRRRTRRRGRRQARELHPASRHAASAVVPGAFHRRTRAQRRPRSVRTRRRWRDSAIRSCARSRA